MSLQKSELPLNDKFIEEIRVEAFKKQMKVEGNLNAISEHICDIAYKLARGSYVDSDYTEKLLKIQDDHRNLDYGKALKRALGIRFRSREGLLRRFFNNIRNSEPLSEQTLVKEALYFYDVLFDEPVNKVYYPFSFTDRTGIYPLLKNIGEVVAVDFAGVGIKGDNIKKIESCVTETQDVIEPDSVDLCVVTPGTPIDGINELDYKFREELRRIMKVGGLLVTPKYFFISEGGDIRESKKPPGNENILNCFLELGQFVFGTNDFGVILVYNKD